MSQTITMTQYGLTETVEKSAEQFAGLTVSRVLSQEIIIEDTTREIATKAIST